MQGTTYKKATELLGQARMIEEQHQKLKTINPRALCLYSGSKYVNISEISLNLAQTIIDITKAEFDRQAKRLEDEFAALQDETDCRRECPRN